MARERRGHRTDFGMRADPGHARGSCSWPSAVAASMAGCMCLPAPSGVIGGVAGRRRRANGRGIAGTGRPTPAATPCRPDLPIVPQPPPTPDRPCPARTSPPRRSPAIPQPPRPDGSHPLGSEPSESTPGPAADIRAPSIPPSAEYPIDLFDGAAAGRAREPADRRGPRPDRRGPGEPVAGAGRDAARAQRGCRLRRPRRQLAAIQRPDPQPLAAERVCRRRCVCRRSDAAAGACRLPRWNRWPTRSTTRWPRTRWCTSPGSTRRPRPTPSCWKSPAITWSCSAPTARLEADRRSADEAEELMRITERYARTGEGRPADFHRAETEWRIAAPRSAAPRRTRPSPRPGSAAACTSIRRSRSARSRTALEVLGSHRPRLRRPGP